MIMAEIATMSSSPEMTTSSGGGKGFNLIRRMDERSSSTGTPSTTTTEQDSSPSASNFINNNNNNTLESVLNSSCNTNNTSSTSSTSPNNNNRSLMDKTSEKTSTDRPLQSVHVHHTNNNNNNNNSPNISNSNNNSKKREEDMGNYSVDKQYSPNSKVSGKITPSGRSSSSLLYETSEDNHTNNNNKTQIQTNQTHQQQMLLAKKREHCEQDEQMVNSPGGGASDQDHDEGQGGMMMIMEDEEDFSQSENEMPIAGEEDDFDDDSDKEEHRITVREALMSRAYQAAAAKFGAGGSGKHPASSGTTSTTGFGGMNATGRSGGMISPHMSHQQQVLHGTNNNNQSMMIKNQSVNGHGVGSRSERHGHHHHHSSSHRSNSFSSSGHHQNQNQNHLQHLSKHYQQLPHSHNNDGDPYNIKAERKSHPSSPVTCDLKPESLAAEGNSGGNLNGIGNALLSLASLGSLAALQQSIPNFMANVVGHSNLNNNNNVNAPLNLTHSTATSNSSSLTPSPHYPSHPHHQQHQHHHSKNSSSLQQQQQCHPSQLQNNLSPNSLIANAIANIASGGSPSSLVNNLNLGGPTGTGNPAGSMPQLILASGQISQGIQGAQLLIPTSQGIMSQTVLTIPITQPGSPQNTMLSPSSQQQHQSNSTGGSGPSTVNSYGHNSHGSNGSKRHHPSHNHNMNLGHHRNLCHPHSPTMTPGVPPSASPDFPGPTGALPAPMMGMSSHLVGQQLGAHMPTIQEKLAMEHNGGGGGLNGLRNSHGKRERESNSGGSSGGLNISSTLGPPKSSPCSTGGSIHSHDSDKFSDNDDDQMVDGINLDEIKEFAKAFKLRRLSLGLTQTQVGQALSVTEGPAYSQSAICSALAWQLAQSQSQSYPPSIHQQSMFEKLDITPKSAQKIKPVLERWMKEAEERYKNGHQNLNEFVGMEPSKKRKRRTSFTPQALEILNNHFERNTHPSGAEITTLAHQLGYEREVIRIWFCNKRQALKNTVRMMSKGNSPM